ncbi:MULTISPECIES: trypsin-like peptidase domain-containing protein [unclassified Streptomyces]|uniref:trypsin-like peptidase domain-containing protein n=1 Tax=unclassified Streptomyces TaxID=2593676 RepID=UPI0008874A19|nr:MULTISPECIES: trypsin-like peptidase domain-containing protein [unclassified Streptomyces]PBC85389.1 hypothetical protein BX261_5396 [Streptomyces sp. 2321.6]SDR16183.1 hypothetical protein SAMN05216511_1865 [Streptomyces sp. KS_16]SED66367.1 hypothetical protein SAMN05428940_5422 [Streptomyces sp. 2133.1]SNC71605.1 hypothetical protein SAMN06272741_5323 [Streptomyces sp. 2114.4]
MALLDADADTALVRIRDLAGRTRGTGFLADHDGTVITSHEAVDGAAQLVLQPMADGAGGGAAGGGGWTCVVAADAVTPLPEAGLALVRAGGFGPHRLTPLPIAAARPTAGTTARLWAGGWLDGTVVGPGSGVMYTAAERVHLLDDTLELGLCAGGREALRLRGLAVGGPVLDARTGAVLGILGTALHPQAPGRGRPGEGAFGRRAGGFAIPLRAVAEAAPQGALAALLERNAATVPAYGSELNPAGARRLAELSKGSAERPRLGREPVERPEAAAEFARFEEGHGTAAACVLGLVGQPGCGRSTELAGLAARRAQGPGLAATIRLRGADLRSDDDGVRTAVERALRSAGRTVAREGRTAGDPADTTSEDVARAAAAAGRPLLVLLDGPEEMPSALAQGERLAGWTTATADWLRTTGVRLVVACRPEYWERAGALFPPGVLHRPLRPAPALPACVELGDLTEEEAERARGRYGLPPGAPAAPDARHPLSLRLLAEVGAALTEGDGTGRCADEPAGLGTPDRHQIFDAYLDLVCLRIAVRLAAGHRPPSRAAAVRRLAAQVAGQVHEAARRCLGPGPGALDRTSFEEVFPREPGWARAVLAEGLLVPAGTGFRFAHEEFAEWLQGAHADLDLLPVPGHRVGPAVQALLLLGRREGAVQLTFRLAELVPMATAPGAAPAAGSPAARAVDGRWWAAHLLSGVLLRVPDARPYTGVLRLLADRITERSLRAGGFAQTGLEAFGPWFWERLALADEDRMDLLRRLLPADGPPCGAGRRAAGAERYAETGTEAEAEEGAAGAVPSGAPSRAGWPVPSPGSSPAERLPSSSSSPLPCSSSSSDPSAWSGPSSWSDRLPSYGPPGAFDPAPGGLSSSAVAVDGPGAGHRFAPPPRVRVHPADDPASGPDGDGRTDALGAPRSSPARADTDGSASAAAPAARTRSAAARSPRFLDAAAALLCADPQRMQPLLCAWFDDTRPLQRPGAEDGGPAHPVEAVPGEITVATAAQALLHTHRHRALDALTEALVQAAHPRGDELMDALAEDEPAAVCRAVDRWAHDARPERRAAAVSYGLRAARHVTAGADRALLRYAALCLLARSADSAHHGSALALLMGDPATRSRFLDRALARFVAGDPQLPPTVFTAALADHPEPVLTAFRARLIGGAGPPVAAALLCMLARTDAPDLVARVADLVRDCARHCPERAARPVAEFIDRRLERGPAARAALRPLAVELLTGSPVAVRCALAAVVAETGCGDSVALRRELLDALLAQEASYVAPHRVHEESEGGRDTRVLEALLEAAAEGAERRPAERTRELVHRTGMLLVRTPAGAACFDRRLVELGRRLPGFARRVQDWVMDEPGEWAAVVGPGARATLAGSHS